MNSTKATCVQCRKIISDRLFLKCLECELKYHLLCTCVNEKIYRLMELDEDHKGKWRCRKCINKASRPGILRTPVPSTSPTPSTSSKPVASCPSVKYLHSQTDRMNITLRRNDLTANLSDDEDSYLTNKVSSLTSELLSDNDQSNVEFCGKDLQVEHEYVDGGKCDFATQTDGGHTDTPLELQRLREHIALLNDYIAKINDSIQVSHIKMDQCCLKLADVDERLVTIEVELKSQDILKQHNLPAVTINNTTQQKPKRKRKIAQSKPNSLPQPHIAVCPVDVSSASAKCPSEVTQLVDINPTQAVTSNDDLPDDEEKVVQRRKAKCHHVSNENADPRSLLTIHSNSALPNVSHEVEDGDLGNWQRAYRGKSRQKPTFNMGTAGPDKTTLRAVEPRKFIHLWNMASGTEEVKSYLKQVCDSECCTVEELRARGDYKSYKIGVPEAMYSKCISPESWPNNAKIKDWQSFRGQRNFQKKSFN